MPSLVITAAALAMAADCPREPAFDGLILAAADADMTASAYADGRLEPLDGAQDSLILAAVRCGRLIELDRAHASNSVIGWPRILAVRQAPAAAFVAETRGPAPRGVTRMDEVNDDFPPGEKLGAFQIAGDRLIPLNEAHTPFNPQSADVDPQGGWVVVSVQEPDGAAFVRLEANGALGEIRRFQVDDAFADLGDGRLRGLFWSPDGRFLAANAANLAIAIYEVTRDEAGDPAGLRLAGPPVRAPGRHAQLTVANWTPDSRYLLVTDTGWGDGAGQSSRGAAMLVQPRGRLLSLSVEPDGAASIADIARTGLSPEGFALSPDGRLAVTVNMRRTYLPDTPLLAFWPGRNRASLSLFEIDPGSGALTPQGREVKFEGVLPEDAVFDATSRALAVAVFHERRGAGRRTGFIDLWQVESSPDGPRLSRSEARLSTVRGVHSLARLNPSSDAE